MTFLLTLTIHFFARILKNTSHVLQQYLPQRPQSQYNLRERSHNKTLINKTVYLNEQDFIIRMIYKDSSMFYNRIIVVLFCCCC